MNGKRPKVRRVLSDPYASVVVVEHRDRLARFGVQHLEVALSAQGNYGAIMVVTDKGEDMIEVLTSVDTEAA